jgi:hypothetical protein
MMKKKEKRKIGKLLFLLFFHFFEKSVFCATELFGFVLLKG